MEVFSEFWLRVQFMMFHADGSAPSALPFLTFLFSGTKTFEERFRILGFAILNYCIFARFDLLCCYSFLSGSLFCLFPWLLSPLLLHLSISRTSVDETAIPRLEIGPTDLYWVTILTITDRNSGIWGSSASETGDWKPGSCSKTGSTALGTEALQSCRCCSQIVGGF